MYAEGRATTKTSFGVMGDRIILKFRELTQVRNAHQPPASSVARYGQAAGQNAKKTSLPLLCS